MMASHIGASAVSAVAYLSQINIMLSALGGGLAVGASIKVSEAYGAGDFELVKRRVSTMFAMCALLGGGLFLFLAPVTPWFLRLMNTPEEFIAEGSTYFVLELFGPVGIVLLGLIFAIACLNTCVGLISCCSDYFAKIFPILGYKAWACFFAVASMLLSNIGLNQILAFSVPVLGAIYPVAIVLIALAFLHPLIGRFSRVYPVSIALTAVVSVFAALDSVHLMPKPLASALHILPFYESNLGWLTPAVLGIILGILFSGKKNKNKEKSNSILLRISG